MSGDVERLAEERELAALLSGAAPKFTHLAIPTHIEQARRLLASDWLAAHDAEVAARALREAAEVADRGTITGLETTRPDLVARWLRRRADRVAGHTPKILAGNTSEEEREETP
jgi:hypothetical protein